ncbi:SdpA family antimicrobial peptide system protein [Dactylosporangium sp. NPDC005555]|uniref:SdpA family antimicrobial peptide system protein n=1 Tax=Dactylosporangium sp. NPDC005555 TaxID=3154889 RepID=UPI0033A9AFAE
MHRPTAAPPARLGAFALALIAAGALAVAYVVHTQLPDNAVDLPYEAAVEEPVRVALPQGWAFFTRDPRGADLLVYTRGGDGRWHDALLSPHAEPRNLFGLARASRAQGVELGLLTGAVPEDGWTGCQADPGPCLERLTPLPAANRARRTTLCGDVGLAQRVPVPWAWSRSGDQVVMPSTVARLAVSC